MAPLCKFYQQGTCRNGSNCRFEHPGAASNPFGGGSNTNRFGALSSGGGGSGGGFGRNASSNADGTNVYKITKDAIKIDLADERPQWILSAYGPGRDAPEQLFGGYPREQSFEEIRLSVLSSPNPQQALQDVQNMYLEAEKQMQAALGNLDGAVQFILAAENKHPNRHDICKQNTQAGGGNGAFAVGNTSSGLAGNPLAAAPVANQNPFGSTQPSPFAASAAAPTTSAFGQPSQMGAKPNPFGAPATAPTTSAFGQPSQMGAKPNPFGQPAPVGGSAFGQPSSLGAKPNPFAANSAAPSGFAAAAQQQTSNSAFGQPSSLGTKPNPFGTPASSGTFGATPSTQNANPFGAPSQPAVPSPFGAPSQPAASAPFGAPSQPSNSSPFGAPALAATASPFGAPAQAQNPSPFGASAPSSTPAANPFGQAPSQPSSFGTKPAAINPFSSTNTNSLSQTMNAQPTPAASNPFAQPTTNGFGSNTSVAGGGGFGAQPAAPVASQGTNSPYPPDSARKHPNIDSYIAKMGTRIIRFKNMPVSYKDDKPGIQTGGGWAKIWFPSGPPNYYADTEPQDKSAYTETIHKIYEESGKMGRFADIMPEVPPMREDCTWDF